MSSEYQSSYQSDGYLRKQYPTLFADYDKREGDVELKKRFQDMFKKIEPMRVVLETFDEEEKRGIIHRGSYSEMMEQYRKDIPLLQEEAVKVMDEWRNTTPPYDPDNHVGSCGCIVKNGERVYWCGDHY
jgi:hypothetical protein